jgi:hypothetical protein
MVPQPSNVAPESEKPRTVVSLAEIIKPASSALPPLALKTVAPSTSNWKPAIPEEELYNTEPPDVIWILWSGILQASPSQSPPVSQSAASQT